MTDYAVKRLREGKVVSFGSNMLPHRIQFNPETQEVTIDIGYATMVLPWRVVEHIGALTKPK